MSYFMDNLNLKCIDLGLISYKKALDFQLQLLEKVHKKMAEETLMICRHPFVLTVGRSATENDIQSWDGEIVKVQRGGGVTFHGPGQIIIYPILDLRKRNRDLHSFLRKLEKSVIETLKLYDIKASCRDGVTGVWVGDKKIASIGIGVKKWISYHGLAFNFKNEFLDQGKFNPCGFSQSTMIGFTDLVNNVSFKEVQKNLVIKLNELFKNHHNKTETSQNTC